MTPLFCLALLAAPSEEAWEYRAAAGAQIDSSPHGVIDLGLRRGALSIQILTDTLDVRYEDRADTHRAWIAARAEGGVAGLLTSPWTEGAPDPARALLGFYFGGEAGWLEYLPAHAYAGVDASARQYFFRGLSETRVAVPEPELVLGLHARLGYFVEGLHATLHGGLTVHGGQPSPDVSVEIVVRPEGTLAPLLEVRAGLAKDQDFITTTRLGGLNPYVVPLAGAAWGEWWVERYLALRAGPAVELGPVQLALVADGARFNGGSALGVALLGRLRLDRWRAEASLGWAPEIPRPEGHSRLSAWVLAGVDWGAW